MAVGTQPYTGIAAVICTQKGRRMSVARTQQWIRLAGRRLTGRSRTVARSGWRSALALLFPPYCFLCGKEITQSNTEPKGLCTACRSHLMAWNCPVCRRCASPLPQFWGDSTQCPRCCDRRYAFNQALALGAYTGVWRDAVLCMKRATFEPLTHAVGQLLAERIRDIIRSPTVKQVVPVPMHWSRRLHRGVQTSRVLSAAIARQLQLPLAAHLLGCRRRTEKQGTLTPSDRFRNVRNAFQANSAYDLSGTDVLLVDDIMTTGATLSEAARALQSAGARSITAVVVARGIGH